MPIDYKRYPPNWKKEIVPAVIKRANNCCEKCGLQNKQEVYATTLWIKENGRYKQRVLWFSNRNDAVRESGNELLVFRKTVVLTVAHLDHDETNWNVSLDRLMAMCQICHLRYDAKEKYRRSLQTKE